jgi:hypothetical protein
MPNTTKPNQSEIARIEIVISNLYTMMLDAKTADEREYCNDAIESYENTLAQLAETEYYHVTDDHDDDDDDHDVFCDTCSDTPEYCDCSHENVREESNWADWPQ